MLINTSLIKVYILKDVDLNEIYVTFVILFIVKLSEYISSACYTIKTINSNKDRVVRLFCHAKL